MVFGVDSAVYSMHHYSRRLCIVTLSTIRTYGLTTFNTICTIFLLVPSFSFIE